MAKKNSLISKNKLLHLYRDKKLSVFRIAEFFDCSAGTIINRMRQYDIKRRHSGPKRINILRKSLYALYIKRRFSANKIAKMCHCEQTAILNRLKKYNIPLENAKKKIDISKKDLYKLYIEEKMSAYKIAKVFKCYHSTIYRYLKIYKIKIRQLKYVYISADELRKLYFDQRLSLKKISKTYNCCAVTILKKMQEFGLKRRTISETSTKHLKKDFDGDNNLKAYMIGFRLGDLRVRKAKNLIDIGCGTTKNDQIELIKSVFGKYGPIFLTNKDERGAMHIDCLLNKSFYFLLPKYDKIPVWILNNRNNFLNFLAGYTDAEGNICISMGRAKFRIRTYDKNILWQINDKLNKIFIKSIFRLEQEAYLRKNGVLQNKDCWGVTVNEKFSLFKILSLLKSMLKHSKRRADLAEALLNVEKRLKIISYEKTISL